MFLVWGVNMQRFGSPHVWCTVLNFFILTCIMNNPGGTHRIVFLPKDMRVFLVWNGVLHCWFLGWFCFWPLVHYNSLLPCKWPRGREAAGKITVCITHIRCLKPLMSVLVTWDIWYAIWVECFEVSRASLQNAYSAIFRTALCTHANFLRDLSWGAFMELWNLFKILTNFCYQYISVYTWLNLKWIHSLMYLLELQNSNLDMTCLCTSIQLMQEYCTNMIL